MYYVVIQYIKYELTKVYILFFNKSNDITKNGIWNRKEQEEIVFTYYVSNILWYKINLCKFASTGMLAQLVQSIALTGRGSLVRVQYISRDIYYKRDI